MGRWSGGGEVYGIGSFYAWGLREVEE